MTPRMNDLADALNLQPDDLKLYGMGANPKDLWGDCASDVLDTITLYFFPHLGRCRLTDKGIET